MTFPTVATNATTLSTSASGGQAVTMPSGIVAGDLLIVACAHDKQGGATAVTASAGWTDITNTANGTVVQLAVFAKIAAGSDTCTITASANDLAVVAIKIRSHRVNDVAVDIFKGTPATGSSASPNPPNCNPNVADDFLWLEVFAAQDDDNTGTYWSTNYTAIAQAESAQTTSSCMAAAAYRTLRAISEDPGNMAMSASDDWVTQTFAIPGVYTTDSTKVGRPKFQTVMRRRRPILKGARKHRISILGPQQTSLSTSAIAHAQSVTVPTLAEHAVITPAAIGHSQSLAVPTISEGGVLAAAALAHAQSLGVPTLAEHAVLSPAALTHAQSLQLSSVTMRDAPDGTLHLRARMFLIMHRRHAPRQKRRHFFRTLTGIFPQSIGHSHTISVPTTTEHSVLTPQAVFHQQLVPAGIVGNTSGKFRFGWRKRRNRHVGHLHPHRLVLVLNQLSFFTPTLIPAAVSHAPTIGVPLLPDHTQIAPVSVLHAQTLDTTTLIRKLVAQALGHAQQLQDGTLTVTGLSPTSISHLVALANATLTQASALVPEALLHGQSVAVPVIVTRAVLSPDDVRHAHTIDSPIVAWLLLPEDVLHGQAVDDTTLNRRVVPAALMHAQQLAESALVVSGAVDPDDILHGVFVAVPGGIGDFNFDGIVITRDGSDIYLVRKRTR